MQTYKIFVESHDRVKQWLRNRAKGTRQLYAIALRDFCKTVNTTPEEWQNMDRFEARDLAWKYVSGFGREDSSKAVTYLAALKSFYRNKDGEQLPFDSKRGGKHYLRKKRKKIDFERIPDKTDTYRIIDASMNLRDRTMFLMLFQSGMRLNALCSLNFGHVREQLYPETKIPLHLKITENIDTKLRAYNISYYYTFLQGEAAQALRNYCDKHHQKSTDDTPLFKTNTGRRIDRRTVWRIFKRSVKRAELNPKSYWVHSLRKSFKKVVNMAPISGDFREALMGHVLPGSRENYFDRHDISELAEEYMKINFAREIPENNHMIMKKQIADLEQKVKTLEAQHQTLITPQFTEALKELPKEQLIQLAANFQKMIERALKEK